MLRKMNRNSDKTRVVIAVTESSPVRQLWRAAMQELRHTRAELLALLVDDDRWRRAASLPFTREISRLSGAVADFTEQRAEQVKKEHLSRTQQRIQSLAADADQSLTFEVLSVSDAKRMEEFIGRGTDILIAPSFITNQPIYAYIAQLDCRILLIEATEEQCESE
jgi:glycine/D-amino acid oxidase-like deaminating enzyme